MPEYQSAEEYISDIQKEIKWKRAKYVATKEIADHITDQNEAYQNSGLSKVEALNKTLFEMGYASKIGIELNLLHRPKTNWLLLILTAVFLIAGTFADIIFSNASYTRNIVAVAVGIAAMTVLYFTDYTILIRFPRILYFSLLAFTSIVLIYDLRNCIQIMGYSYSFYPLLLIPLTQIGVALQIKNKDSCTGMLQLILYLLPPLIIASILASLPAAIIIFIFDIALISYVMVKKWYIINKFTVIGILCLAVILVFGMMYANMLTNMWSNFFDTNGNYLSQITRSTIFDLKFVENSSKSAEIYAANSEYSLMRLATRYGFGVFIVSGILFAAFIICVIQIIKKQTAYIGQLLSYVIMTLFSLQFILSILGNLGLINGNYIMPYPFVASGGIFTIYNLLLIGILLSIYRHQDIAKDWLKIKSEKEQL